MNKNLSAGRRGFKKIVKFFWTVAIIIVVLSMIAFLFIPML